MNCHSGDDELSVAAIDQVRDWSRSLEDRTARALGVPVTDARRSLSRRLGIAPGTLETLRNGRLKRLTTAVADRVRAALIADLETEIARLTHELEMARQTGVDPRSADLDAVASALDQARTLLRGR